MSTEIGARGTDVVNEFCTYWPHNGVPYIPAYAGKFPGCLADIKGIISGWGN